MKILKLLTLGIILFASSTINAQVSVNLNIGTAPSWGPQGYSDVDYYYLPDVEAYYDIRATQFIYFNGGRWTRSRYLPGQYRNYDLYNGYKVVLNDYHGSRPYSNYRNDRVRYYKGYHGRPQRSIGAYRNNDRREYENRGDHGNRGYNRGNEGHGNKGHGNEGRGNNGHGNEGHGNNVNGRGHSRG